jgi:hypothetical protein
MFALFRIIVTAAFLYAMYTGIKKADTASMGTAGDTEGAIVLAQCVALGLLTAICWGSYIGGKIADPLTGVLTDGTYGESKRWNLGFIQFAFRKNMRGLALMLCFFEGLNRPDSPPAFILGMKNAIPGSWLQKVFAREVFRFSNAQNAVQAFLILKQFGYDPGMHEHPEVNILIQKLEPEIERERSKFAVPKAELAPFLKRNRRVRLFDEPEQENSPEQPPSDKPDPNH